MSCNLVNEIAIYFRKDNYVFPINNEKENSHNTAKSWSNTKEPKYILKNEFNYIKVINFEHRGSGVTVFKAELKIENEFGIIDIRDYSIIEMLKKYGCEKDFIIKGDFLFIQNNANMVLTYKDSELHKEAINNKLEKERVKLEKIKKFEMFNIYELSSGEYIFLGEYKINKVILENGIIKVTNKFEKIKLWHSVFINSKKEISFYTFEIINNPIVTSKSEEVSYHKFDIPKFLDSEKPYFHDIKCSVKSIKILLALSQKHNIDFARLFANILIQGFKINYYYESKIKIEYKNRLYCL